MKLRMTLRDKIKCAITVPFDANGHSDYVAWNDEATEVMTVIHEWGEEPCPHSLHSGDIKRECRQCWAELKEAK